MRSGAGGARSLGKRCTRVWGGSHCAYASDSDCGGERAFSEWAAPGCPWGRSKQQKLAGGVSVDVSLRKRGKEFVGGGLASKMDKKLEGLRWSEAER